MLGFANQISKRKGRSRTGCENLAGVLTYPLQKQIGGEVSVGVCLVDTMGIGGI